MRTNGFFSGPVRAFGPTFFRSLVFLVEFLLILIANSVGVRLLFDCVGVSITVYSGEAALLEQLLIHI